MAAQRGQSAKSWRGQWWGTSMLRKSIECLEGLALEFGFYPLLRAESLGKKNDNRKCRIGDLLLCTRKEGERKGISGADTRSDWWEDGATGSSRKAVKLEVERGGLPSGGSGDARQQCGKNEDARQVRKEHRGQRLKVWEEYHPGTQWLKAHGECHWNSWGQGRFWRAPSWGVLILHYCVMEAFRAGRKSSPCWGVGVSGCRQGLPGWEPWLSLSPGSITFCLCPLGTLGHPLGLCLLIC